MNKQSSPTENLLLLPYGDDPFTVLADRLLRDHASSLPRLEHVTILLPCLSEAARLRRVLLEQSKEQGYPALLGPNILEWHSWLNRYPLPEKVSTSNYRRELILIAALRQHEQLFAGANLWALADSLLSLFDELTLNRVGLPPDMATFTRRIAQAYGIQQQSLDALQREAQLVHTLWHAWHQELESRGVIDKNTRTLLQLTATIDDPSATNLYLLAPDITSDAETLWLEKMVATGKLTLLLHGHHHGTPSRTYHPEFPLHRLLEALHAKTLQQRPTSDFSRLLDTVFASDPQNDATLRERAAAFASQVEQSPLEGRIAVFGAGSDEEEARAVSLQLRRWLLEGHRHIGIVTENRRLARRVRALLERAGITLEDAAGWALSTTSAAAALERWLQCVEEDFPHGAMLDLLKSAFFCTPERRDAQLELVYRLEQDIVLHENIGSGLQRYRQHLSYRQQRLPAELAEQLQQVDTLLDRMGQAASPLQQLLDKPQSEAAVLLDLLLQSLEQLGMTAQFAADAAGMRLLEELQKMRQAVDEEPMQMGWIEFRGWLGRTLERYTFQPPSSTHAVNLMGLSQSPLAHFDALILAGVEREFLPGTPAASPFFNDAVRTELGLHAGDALLADRYYHFRRLLEAAPRVLLTHRIQSNDEEIPPSPWLELLQSFQQLAYGRTLSDPQLEQMLAGTECEVVQRQQPLPRPARMPQPVLEAGLLPRRYSASAYQQLMDCPYQFFAARGLGLAAPEAIHEALEKSDYGERVHRCLEAFHGNVDKLPGPYTGSWEQRYRGEAIDLLHRISEAVFARDLEDNFLHRGWLQRWQEKIPSYIDWQLERAAAWHVEQVEQQRELSVSGVTLYGRLDRIDAGATGLAIVDYKTGRSAGEDEVLEGEAVQLPFYALLAADSNRPVSRVEYLALDEIPVTGKASLEDESLFSLSEATGERLADLHRQMATGSALPAWGDSKTCGYCKMSGVCRRQSWIDNKKGS